MPLKHLAVASLFGLVGWVVIIGGAWWIWTALT